MVGMPEPSGVTPMRHLLQGPATAVEAIRGRHGFTLPTTPIELPEGLATGCQLDYRGGPCQRDRILDRISDPIFGSYPATLFSQQRAYKLANVSHTLVSKVETIAVCEKERVAHVCCAPLAQCMPVHAHCGAHACSVPQEERKSQCTICQSCNLKLPRRCHSNTQFCALCRFGRRRLGLGRARVRMDSSRL